MGQEVVTYKKQWAAEAQQLADKEKTSGQFISTRGGVFQIDGDEVPGNQLCVVILGSIFENTYYDLAFDDDGPVMPPRCFAMAVEDEDLAPHPAMQKDLDYFEPQNEDCETCPLNEWGSADKGKGKACANRRRLALIPAGVFERIKGTKGEYDVDIFEDVEHYQEADMLALKLPVTSVKEYSKYVRSLQSQHNRPPHGVITQIYIDRDPKSQFKIKFEMLELLPDEMYPIISARHKNALKDLIQPYNPPDAEDEDRPRSRNRLKERLKK